MADNFQKEDSNWTDVKPGAPPFGSPPSASEIPSFGGTPPGTPPGAPSPSSQSEMPPFPPSQSSREAPQYPQMVLGAVESYFVAEHTRAVANLNNYLQHPVGVGEHPDIVEECVRLFERLAHVEGCLSSIRKVPS